MSTRTPKVNYSLRPGKAAVRRMVVEILSRLEPITPVSQYAYVGFGSLFFEDFQLIHRRLGINQMTTIEKDLSLSQRIEFNRPFSCITKVMKHSNTALQQMQLQSGPHIVWLDYENMLNREVLIDIEEIITRCASGSAVFLTVNVGRPRSRDARKRWLNQLQDVLDLPEPREPENVDDYPLLSYRVVKLAVDLALEKRNAGRTPALHLHFRQALHATYADGAPMLTVGGVLVSTEDEAKWRSSGVESLDCARTGEDALNVVLPFLTRREVFHLAERLPATETSGFFDCAERMGLERRDAEQLAEVYRYAAFFFESDDW